MWVGHQDLFFGLLSFWISAGAHRQGTSLYHSGKEKFSEDGSSMSLKVGRLKSLVPMTDPGWILKHYPGTHLFAFI